MKGAFVALAALSVASCAAGPAGQTRAAADGQAVYEAECLTCHQADGGGVPRMQPPLRAGPWVLGEPDTLAAFVISGGFDSGGRTATTTHNVMPAFGHLDDEALAAVLTYIRTHFGNEASPVSVDDVAKGRELTAE